MHVHVGCRRPRQGDPRRQRDARARPDPARRCRPTRRSGAPTPPVWPRRARRSSAPSRASGIPPTYKDWADYEQRIEFMIDARVIEDYTYLWHDVRPHPNFGTVEIRVMDSQTRVEHTLGLAALVQALVRELCRALRRRQAALALPVRDARREQVAGRPARPRRRAGRPAPVGPGAGARAGPPAARPDARACAGPGFVGRARGRRGSARATATAPRARSWSTRPTTTCARSWRRSSPRPRCSGHPRHDAGSDSVARFAAVIQSIRAMSTGGPDLFVICKNCQSEVSPYITECPYCGSRLRKRAPKLDRGGPPHRAQAPRAEAVAAAAAPWRDPGHPA